MLVLTSMDATTPSSSGVEEEVPDCKIKGAQVYEHVCMYEDTFS